jgi:hypothetical protein
MCGLQPIVKGLTIVILTLSKLNENQKPKACLEIRRTTPHLPGPPAVAGGILPMAHVDCSPQLPPP